MASTDKTTADKTTADKTGTDKTPAETARQSDAAEPNQRLADEQTLNQTNSPDGAQADQPTDQQTDADDLTTPSCSTEANDEISRPKRWKEVILRGVAATQKCWKDVNTPHPESGAAEPDHVQADQSTNQLVDANDFTILSCLTEANAEIVRLNEIIRLKDEIIRLNDEIVRMKATPSPSELEDRLTEANAEIGRLKNTALSSSELENRLTEANAEIVRMEGINQQARADVENIQRRSQKEIDKAHKYAIEGFAQELLGVRDSLDRASAVELDESAGEAVRQMKEGLGLTLKQLDSAMAKFAVVEVEAALGIRFDPERHQAISTASSDDVGTDHIVSVAQKGFLLKDRLLRPAMVVVATKE